MQSHTGLSPRLQTHADLQACLIRVCRSRLYQKRGHLSYSAPPPIEAQVLRVRPASVKLHGPMHKCLQRATGH